MKNKVREEMHNEVRENYNGSYVDFIMGNKPIGGKKNVNIAHTKKYNCTGHPERDVISKKD